MSNLSLRLPESLHKQVKELAKKEGVSINQFVTTALAEKLSALMTQDYLEARAQRGNRGVFERVRERIPDAEPEERDRGSPELCAPVPRHCKITSKVTL